MKGFTLLEVMIALAIMSGVIITVISSFNYYLSVAARDREETIAMLAARAKLEEPGFTDLKETKGTFSPDWPWLTWEAETSPTIVSGVVRLTLTVRWDDARRKLTLAQYIKK